MSSENPAPCPPTFEVALEQLEEIVHQLEDGSLGLEESLARYEHGVGLIKHCYGVLERVERRIELLAGVDAEGKPVTEPFDDSATFNAETAAAPEGKRASSPTKRPRKAVKIEPDDANGDMDVRPTLF